MLKKDNLYFGTRLSGTSTRHAGFLLLEISLHWFWRVFGIHAAMEIITHLCGERFTHCQRSGIYYLYQ